VAALAAAARVTLALSGRVAQVHQAKGIAAVLVYPPPVKVVAVVALVPLGTVVLAAAAVAEDLRRPLLELRLRELVVVVGFLAVLAGLAAAAAQVSTALRIQVAVQVQGLQAAAAPA